MTMIGTLKKSDMAESVGLSERLNRYMIVNLYNKMVDNCLFF